MIQYLSNEQYNGQLNMKNFKEELYENDYNFCQDAIQNNFDRWAINKERVYNLLRKHPNWREDLMAIECKIDFERSTGNTNVFLNRIRSKLKTAHQWRIKKPYTYSLVEDFLDDFVNLVGTQDNKITQNMVDYYKKSYDYLNSEYSSYNRTMEEIFSLKDKTMEEKIQLARNNWSMSTVINYIFGCYRKLHNQQPLNRALIAIFKLLELDKENGIFNMYDYKDYEPFKEGTKFYNQDGTWFIDWYYSLEQLMQRFSDLCQSKVYQKKFYISINPLDYLTQSNGEHLRESSCHSLEDKGCYHGGIISMMTDPSTCIVYEMDADKEYDPNNYEEWFNDKIQRQILVFDDDLKGYFQSVWYPYKTTEYNQYIIDIINPLLENNNYLETIRDSYIMSNYKYVRNYDNTYYLSYEDWCNGKEMFLTRPKDQSLNFTIGGEWYTTDNSIAPTREDADYTNTLDFSGYNSDRVWCVDSDRYRYSDDAYYAVDEDEWYEYNANLYYASDSGKWYANDDDLYYTSDTEEYYDDIDSVYRAVDTNNYYRRSRNLYYAQDECEYYECEDSLYYTADTHNWFASCDDLYYAEDTGYWFEFSDDLYQDIDGNYYEDKDNIPENKRIEDNEGLDA